MYLLFARNKANGLFDYENFTVNIIQLKVFEEKTL